MSVRWERFAGDTASFAVRVAFHRDPDHGEAASPEMAESWGAFQIWVRGVNLCAHMDSGETMQFSHWYLLPILEWLSANWDPLLHEERPPSSRRSVSTAADVGGPAASMAFAFPYDSGARSRRDDHVRPLREKAALSRREEHYEWNQRHALRTSRDGGVVPDVRLRRIRDQVEISWTATRLAGAEDVDFLSHRGTQYVAPSTVAEPLFEVLASASEWLHERLPASERCQALVDSVAALRSPARADERTAWIAGLGTTRERVVARWERLRELSTSLGSKGAFEAVFGSQPSNDVVLDGSCEAALLFGSVSPTIALEDAEILARLLLEEYEPSPVDGLAHLVADEPTDVSTPPWHHGYLLADELLHEISDEHIGQRVDVEKLLKGWSVRLLEVSLKDPNLRAVALVGSNHAPSIVLNSGYQWAGSDQARRFTLAHELCHLLHDRSRGARVAMASGPWAPRAIEQRANAFAAWLLMPPRLLDDAVSAAQRPVDTPEGVWEVADGLDVSRATLVEHLYNRGYIDWEARNWLRPGLGE